MPSKYQATIKMPHSINYKKQNQAKAKHHVYKFFSPSPSTKSLVCFNFWYLMALFHPIRVSLPSIHVTSVFFPSVGANTFFCSLLLLRCVFLFLIWCCIVVHLCCLVVPHCNSLLLFLDGTFLLKMPTCYSLLLFNGASLLFLDLVVAITLHLLPIVCFCCSPTPHYSFWLFPNTSLLLFTFVIIVHFHYYTSTQHATHKIRYLLAYCSLLMFQFYSLLLFTFGFIPLWFGTSPNVYKCGRKSLKFWFFQIKASSSSFQIQVHSR